VTNELYHHTFSPWAVRDGHRIVAEEREWETCEEFEIYAKMRPELDLDCNPIRILIDCDLFEPWDGPMSDARGGTWSTADHGHWWNYQHETTDDDWNCRDVTIADVLRRVFALIDRTPNITWLASTAYPERIAVAIDNCDVGLGESMDIAGRFPNLWPGARIRTQADADARIPHLSTVPAAVRWLDVVPVGPVDLATFELEYDRTTGHVHGGANWRADGIGTPLLHWIVVRGETGPNATPLHPDWVRSLRDQCQHAGVPFWFDGWGEWIAVPEGWMDTMEKCPCGKSPIDSLPVRNEDGTIFVRFGAANSGCTLDGRVWRELPEATTH
jgi:protein gp37